jgi:hypothetical protein
MWHQSYEIDLWKKQEDARRYFLGGSDDLKTYRAISSSSSA